MNLLQVAGAPPQKQPRWVPIFIDRAFTGLWTQRNPLHDPSDVATLRFYGGRPDALLDGSNVELTNRLTLQRRPGLSPFSIATYPTPPLRAFSFGLTDGTIQVIVDTGSTPAFALNRVNESSGVAYYLFTSSQSTAANNAFVGLIFQVSGFDNGLNNGIFVCDGSTSTFLILRNPVAQTDTANATAISAGAVYIDQQNGGPSFALSSVNFLCGVAFYLFSSPQLGAANNGFLGQIFNVTGFDVASNNGQFVCLSSTANYMILDNELAVTDIFPASAMSVDKVLLFPKAPGAGQTYFVGVAGTLYMGDGVETKKYTPKNPNGLLWNWGITPPTTQPSVSTVASGSAATSWVATTIFSTMGLIVDPNGNTQQLFSVNATGTNPPPATLGVSGVGTPNFNTTRGATTSDGSVVWTSEGQITFWTPNTTFFTSQPIYDPITNSIFIMERSSPSLSGSTKPAFNSTLGSHTDDTSSSNNARWQNLGVVNSPGARAFGNVVSTWAKNASYNQFTSGIENNFQAAIVFPLIPNAANIQAGVNGTGPKTYLLGATTAGTTANTVYNPWNGIPPSGPGSQIAGHITQDFTSGATTGLQWLNLGSATWKANTQYSQWFAPFQIFSCIKDPNGNMQVCTVGGQSGSVQPTFQTAYGSITQDNGVQWTCVTNSLSWTSNTQWQLPLVGFSPPGLAQPFGGSEVVGSVFVQAVIASGLSGSSQPFWSTVISNTTQDNAITWETVASFSQQSLVWTKGHVYAYSWASRLTTDFFNTNPPPGLLAKFASGIGTPTGSRTGVISTASSVFTITGANTGAVNTVSGLGSTDPQVDTIIVWRDADGGGPNNMFFLTEFPAPSPIGGVAQPWNFQDFLPDVATTFGSVISPGLNNLIPAPIVSSNNPPPPAFLPMVYNFQRIWGGNGLQVPFSGGPDVITGNPNEAFNPLDEFPYLAPVVRVVKNSQGLVVLLTDSIEFLGGGPQTSSFYSVTLAPGIGLGNYNGLDVYAGEIYFLSADSQLKTINPSLQLSNTGFPIGDKLAALNPLTAQVAVQQAGVDNAIYVADGSTGWFRCNPHQVPGGAGGPEPIWSPFANITNGCMMVESVEVAPGIKKLLVGATGPNKQILQRNLTVFTDNGASYDAFFTMGSIMLAHPGQLALLKFIEGDFNGVSYQPQVSYLLNEISGIFTNMSLIPVFDPPQIYGTTIIPKSYSPNRYYFSSTGSLARCRHLQVKVDFGTTPNGDELFNLTIFGRLMVEL